MKTVLSQSKLIRLILFFTNRRVFLNPTVAKVRKWFKINFDIVNCQFQSFWLICVHLEGQNTYLSCYYRRSTRNVKSGQFETFEHFFFVFVLLFLVIFYLCFANFGRKSINLRYGSERFVKICNWKQNWASCGNFWQFLAFFGNIFLIFCMFLLIFGHFS